MNDETSVAAENGVEFIPASHREALDSPFPEAMELTPEVPAPRSLTEVAADRPLIP